MAPLQSHSLGLMVTEDQTKAKESQMNVNAQLLWSFVSAVPVITIVSVVWLVKLILY